MQDGLLAEKGQSWQNNNIMKAEVIAIGDELTSGQRLDTNSQWISARLGDLGIRTIYHTTASDEIGPLADALKIALNRSDLLLITGGLGPTPDDLTRDALANALGVPLELDEASLRGIEQLFAKRGHTMPERNRLQATFPRGTRPINNPNGTAPGIHFIHCREDGTQCELFALPGVPAEMHQMWHETVTGQLTGEAKPSQIIQHLCIKCFGAGESVIEQRLTGLIDRGRDPAVGITVHNATITLRITTAGDSAEQCAERMQPTIRTIHESLGDLVFGEGDDELQHVVIRLLAERGQTLASAECGSSGRLAHWLSEIGSTTYRGGLVASAEPPENLISQSAILAENGASSCRDQFGADYAIALGPIAESTVRAGGDFHYAVATPGFRDPQIRQHEWPSETPEGSRSEASTEFASAPFARNRVTGGNGTHHRHPSSFSPKVTGRPTEASTRDKNSLRGISRAPSESVCADICWISSRQKPRAARWCTRCTNATFEASRRR